MIELLEALGLLLLDETSPEAEVELTPLIALSLETARADRDQRALAMLLALSGAGGQPHRRLELLSLVSSGTEVDHIVCFWMETLAPQARRELELSPRPPADEFLEDLQPCFSWYTSYLRIMGMGLEHRAASREATSPWLAEGAREDVDAALAFLERTSDWYGSWEVQDRGVAGSGELLVGSWFHRGFILRELHSMGEPLDDAIAALLDEAPPEGLRWYGLWRGIPPDADSLGLALDLASRIEVSPARVERWLDPLFASLPQNRVTTTWFDRDSSGPTMDDGEPTYRGNECTSVRLALLLGMVRYDATRFGELIEANLRDLLERRGPEGFRGVYFYGGEYTDALFVELARSCLAEPELRLDPSLHLDLERALDVVGERAHDSQRLDGGWGSPQRTAFRLRASFGPRADQLRAIRYLCETQRPDGSWSAEPFYLMPGKADSVAWHLGRELTTAICARSIAAALNEVGSGTCQIV
jgi:hypothetical protein